MSEQEKQDSQKTVVAFIAGLLIGGLLVYVFASPSKAPESADQVTTDDPNEVVLDEQTNGDRDVEVEESATPTAPKAELKTGSASVKIANNKAGSMIEIASATFPEDNGWIAVRDYEGEVLGQILGASRFSKEQGLVPQSIDLLRSTEAGKTYAIVFFTENGDRKFDLSTDRQIEGIATEFTAN